MSPKSFPQQHVAILWNAAPAVVAVMFVPREAMTDDPDEPYFGFEDYASEWDFARGNINGNWLRDAAHTPAAVFGQLLATRSTNSPRSRKRVGPRRCWGRWGRVEAETRI